MTGKVGRDGIFPAGELAGEVDVGEEVGLRGGVEGDAGDETVGVGGSV